MLEEEYEYLRLRETDKVLSLEYKEHMFLRIRDCKNYLEYHEIPADFAFAISDCFIDTLIYNGFNCKECKHTIPNSIGVECYAYIAHLFK